MGIDSEHATAHCRPQLRPQRESFTALSVDSVKATAQRLETILFDELPEWCQDNPAVKSGYRRISNSTAACFKSLVSLHNETVNIHTHLVSAIALAFFLIFVQAKIQQYYPHAPVLDRVVIGVNVFAAMVTFTLSAFYHTLICHSMNMSSLWLRIDYVGILTLIVGSFFSGIYVGFYCMPTLRTLYWTMIVSLSVGTATLVLHPSLQTFNYRSLKAYAFTATALTGLAPIGHGLYLYGWNEMWTRSGMPYYFLEGIFYALGVFFFISRVPESVWPISFDIWLSSHQLFHILVVVAAATHLYGVWQAFTWNYSNPGACQA